jgi:hypothetical protein
MKQTAHQSLIAYAHMEESSAFQEISGHGVSHGIPSQKEDKLLNIIDINGLFTIGQE